MRYLRTLSTRGLVLVLTVAAALTVGAVIAVAASGGSGPTPPPKPLASALLDAAQAPKPEGLTARIAFKNNLFPSGSLLGEVGSALMSGATGRLWVTNDGRGRLELQSSAGDAQIMWSPTDVTVYDASSESVYHAKLPARKQEAERDRHAPPTLAQIERFLSKLGAKATISPAEPTNVAGEPAYSVSLSPKDHGGLLDSLQLAWDATHGVPLRVAVYARGMSSPVLELVATDISYGPVSTDALHVAPPSGAKKTELGAPGGQGEGADRPDSAGTSSYATLAPKTLAGLPRTHEHQIGAGAISVYGQGLGSLVVVERKADAAHGGTEMLSGLPTISVGGIKGHVLATPLVNAVAWRSDGTDYVVAASLPQGTVEAAARSLR